LGKAEEVEAIVSRNKNLVHDASDQEELSANLEKLYRELWAPIEQSLPRRVRRVASALTVN
jgi:hypothetical protein